MDLLADDEPPSPSAPDGQLGEGLPCSICFRNSFQKCTGGCGGCVPVCGACLDAGKVCRFCADRALFESASALPEPPKAAAEVAREPQGSEGSSAPTSRAAQQARGAPQARGPAAHEDEEASPDTWKEYPLDGDGEDSEGDTPFRPYEPPRLPAVSSARLGPASSAVLGKPAADEAEEEEEEDHQETDAFLDPWKAEDRSSRPKTAVVKEHLVDFVARQRWADVTVKGVKVRREVTLSAIAGLLLLMLVLLMRPAGAPAGQPSLRGQARPTAAPFAAPAEEPAEAEEEEEEEEPEAVPQPVALPPKFSLARAGTNECPPGSKCIPAMDICQRAAAELKKGWAGKPVQGSAAKVEHNRCYAIGQHILFKTFRVGQPHLNAQLVCESGDGPPCVDLDVLIATAKKDDKVNKKRKKGNE